MSLVIVPLLYPDLAELLNPFQNNIRVADNTRTAFVTTRAFRCRRIRKKNHANVPLLVVALPECVGDYERAASFKS
jgi:hypothetical protein